MAHTPVLRVGLGFLFSAYRDRETKRQAFLKN
jgi:hypothetical protein